MDSQFTWLDSRHLSYTVNVGNRTGTWHVQVKDGARLSGEGSFKVNPAESSPTPGPGYGSLRVALAPAGAAASGAQWSVYTRPYRNSGDTETTIVPGPATVVFKPVAGYATPPNQTVTIISGTTVQATGTYTAAAPASYQLTVNTPHGSFSRSPDAVFFPAGTQVRVRAFPETGYHFVDWAGDASGTDPVIDILMDKNKTVTANVAAGDLSRTSLTVTIQPPAAIPLGGQWRMNNGPWQNSGITIPNLSVGDIYVEFSSFPGWNRPEPQQVRLQGGVPTTLTGTYVPNNALGALQVSLSPMDAVTAGAQWRANGGAWQNTGVSMNTTPGNYNVEFRSGGGWTTPAPQTASVQPGQVTIVSGLYSPPVGQPVILSISPPTGPLAGGTAVNIEGGNFAPGATVIFGGVPAASLTVESANRISAVTPARPAYGTVGVQVNVNGQSAAKANGFTYAVPRGRNLELLGQIGGSVTAVELAGPLAWIGEGSGLVAVRVSDPSSPSEVGRIGLPGLVSDIALFNSDAYIANEESGVQVVDISNAAAPGVRGFYDTPGEAHALTVLGGRAYVADGNAGLQILDLTNPSAMTRAGDADTPGVARGIQVVTRAVGVFALVADGPNGMQVIDVSDPARPILGAQVNTGPSASCVAVSGNYAYVGDDGAGGVQIVNITDPRAPAIAGTLGGWGGNTCSSLSVAGGKLYAGSIISGSVYSLGNPAAPASLSPFPPPIAASQITGSGNLIFAAAGNALKIADISNPSIPVLRGAYTPHVNFAKRVDMEGSNSFVCDFENNGGLRVVSLLNPASPSLIGASIVSGTNSENITVSSNRAWLCLGNAGIRILDVSNPSNPVTAATLADSALAFFDVALAGSTACWTGAQASPIQKARMGMIDTGNPSSPFLKGQLDLGPDNDFKFGQAVVLRGNHAYIANHDYGLRIVDVSDPGAPALRGSVAAPFTRGVAVSDDGRHAYLACQDGLRVVDVSDPSNPVLLSTVNTGAPCIDIAQSQGLVFVAASVRGLLVYNVGNPSAPVEAASYDTAWSAFGVDVIDDLISVCDGAGGLVVLRLRDTAAPEVVITNPVFASSFSTSAGSTALGGSASDNKGIARVVWSNSGGGGGEAAGTSDWSVANVPLFPGINAVTVTAYDLAGNTGSDTITITREVPKASQEITFRNPPDHTYLDPPFPLLATSGSGLPVVLSVVSGPATISGGLITLTGAGSVTVRAAQPGNSAFTAAAAVDRTFAVAKAAQSVLWTPVPDKAAGDAPFAVTAGSSSGLAVTYSVVSGPASVSGNLVTLNGQGGVLLKASQEGSGNYLSADAGTAFTVYGIPQTIAFGPLSQQLVGDAPFLLSGVSNAGLPVAFSVLSGPALLSGNLLTVTGPGLVVVRASVSGDAAHAPTTLDQAFAVVPGLNMLTEPLIFADGSLYFRFYGAIGTDYLLQKSSDPLLWEAAAPFQVNGLGYYDVFTPVIGPRAYYRVAKP